MTAALFALPVSDESQPRLQVVRCELASAQAFTRDWHRHHGKVTGHIVSLAVLDDIGAVRGIAIIGRPVARGYDDGTRIEVTRLTTDGCPNACSCLYAAANRERRRRGYPTIITYILDSEPGTSLRAAGWKFSHHVRGRTWSCDSRPRTDKHPTVDKQCWYAGEQPNR